MMEDLIDILHNGNHSLVVANGDVATFDGRGVSDLYRILNEDTGFLEGAAIADKVVGKAAAALMILGGVKELYADVISQPALDLFADSGIHASYGTVVSHIINRTRTGWCPLEERCKTVKKAEDCLAVIEEFTTKMLS